MIRRTLEELQDHCADAEAAAIAAGASRRQARRQARLCLGSAERIVDEASARRELLDWRHRWPQSARCLDSLGYCLLLPAVPFAYCASHAASITRWGLSSSLALCITAALLLALQWVIVV
ncbi:MAG: permease prefix domain 1-containing protein [Gammaproteobacteria bacterium]|nr:permease prefix domain 1-containing protein [Gammaproteobacteria bacterium]